MGLPQILDTENNLVITLDSVLTVASRIVDPSRDSSRLRARDTETIQNLVDE
jgi:hypothetical protein